MPAARRSCTTCCQPVERWRGTRGRAVTHMPYPAGSKTTKPQDSLGASLDWLKIGTVGAPKLFTTTVYPSTVTLPGSPVRSEKSETCPSSTSLVHLSLRRSRSELLNMSSCKQVGFDNAERSGMWGAGLVVGVCVEIRLRWLGCSKLAATQAQDGSERAAGACCTVSQPRSCSPWALTHRAVGVGGDGGEQGEWVHDCPCAVGPQPPIGDVRVEGAKPCAAAER